MLSQRRVLIVDDEPDIRDGVSRWLDAAGYATLTAGDGEQGVATATEVRPDAILLDVRMPKLDGMQALAQLRRDERTERIPVVMLSASLRDEQKALDAGARFFVQKPYSGKSLVSIVAAACDEVRAKAPTPLPHTED